MKRLLLSSALILFVLSFGSAQTDNLRENFHHPPESARPWVYWVWMDGNITREGITADLESMKEAGIGGVCSAGRQCFRIVRRVGVAVSGSSGQGCFGYLARSCFLISG